MSSVTCLESDVDPKVYELVTTGALSSQTNGVERMDGNKKEKTRGPDCGTCHTRIELHVDGLPPKYCYNCGSVLTLNFQDLVPVSDLDLCPCCGATVKIRVDGKCARFCSTCGYRLTAPPLLNKPLIPHTVSSAGFLPLSIHPMTANTGTTLLSASDLEVGTSVRPKIITLILDQPSQVPPGNLSTKPANNALFTAQTELDNNEIGLSTIDLLQESSVAAPLPVTQPSNAAAHSFDVTPVPAIALPTIELPVSPDINIAGCSQSLPIQTTSRSTLTASTAPTVDGEMIKEKPNQPSAAAITAGHINQSDQSASVPKPAEATVSPKADIQITKEKNSRVIALPRNIDKVPNSIVVHNGVKYTKYCIPVANSPGEYRNVLLPLKQRDSKKPKKCVSGARKPSTTETTKDLVGNPDHRPELHNRCSLPTLNPITTITTSSQSLSNTSASPPPHGGSSRPDTNPIHSFYNKPSLWSALHGSINLHADATKMGPEPSDQPLDRVHSCTEVNMPPHGHSSLTNTDFSTGIPEEVRTMPNIQSPVLHSVGDEGCSQSSKPLPPLTSLIRSSMSKPNVIKAATEMSSESNVIKAATMTSKPAAGRLIEEEKANTIAFSGVPPSIVIHNGKMYTKLLIPLTNSPGECHTVLIPVQKQIENPKKSISGCKRKLTTTASKELKENREHHPEQHNGCSLPILTQLTPSIKSSNNKQGAAEEVQGNDGLSHPDTKLILAASVQPDIKAGAMDTEHEMECMDGRDDTEQLEPLLSYSTSPYDYRLDADAVPEEPAVKIETEVKKEVVPAEEMTVKQESGHCVVCNFHPGSALLLAQHYTDEHTTPILQVFNASHFDSKRRRILDPSHGLASSLQYEYLSTSSDFDHGIVKQETGSDFSGVKCDMLYCGIEGCNMRFVSYVDLKHHQLTKHPHCQAFCKCPSCGVLLNYQAMTWHMDRNKCVRCRRCDQTFLLNDTLEDHLKTCDATGPSRKIDFTVCFKCAEFNYCYCNGYLKCAACGKRFYTKKGVVNHNRVKHRGISKEVNHNRVKHRGISKEEVRSHARGKTSRHCPLCEHTCTSTHYLKNHLLTHFKGIVSDSVRGHCTICSQDVSHKSLSNHVRLRHFLSDDPEYCKKCNLCMDNVNVGVRHVKSHHYMLTIPETAESFKCVWCDGAMRSMNDMINHSQQHIALFSSPDENLGPMMLMRECYNCGLNFASFCELIYHRTKTHKPLIKCILCDAEYGYAKELEHHILIDHFTETNDSPTKVCRLCNRKLKTVSEVVSHLRQCHGDLYDLSRFDGIEMINCGLCRREMKSIEDYVTHGCVNDSLIICVMCFEEYDTEEELRSHIGNTHIQGIDDEGMMPVACTSCDRVFPTRQQTKWHINDMHGSEANCHICFAAFGSVRQCLEHADSHFIEGNASFVNLNSDLHKCLFCYTKLVSKEYSGDHIRAHYEPSLNSRISTAACYNCTELLQDEYDAVRHSKLHAEEGSGSTIYCCAVCNENCGEYSADVETHTKMHYGRGTTIRSIDVKCLECDYEARSTRALCNHYKVVHQVTGQHYYRSWLTRKNIERGISVIRKQRTVRRRITVTPGKDNCKGGRMRRYQCDQCDEVFDFKKALTEHISAVHQEEAEGEDSDHESDGGWYPDINEESDGDWNPDKNTESDGSDFELSE